MARTRRSRLIAATPEAVWAVVADPSHIPRWWPGVTRVEGVHAGHFTEVIPTGRGRPVRLDFDVAVAEPPQRLIWHQALAGTPFERLLSAWTTTITLVPGGDDGCLVTIDEHQRLRGWLRVGSVLQLRPARRRVEAALDGLAALF